MNCNSQGNWFAVHHGEMFHPLEVVSFLGKFYLNPIAKYHFLEEAGHIIPMNYKDGEINSVKIFYPKRDNIKDIEQDFGFKRGQLVSKLQYVFVNGSVRSGVLRLGEDALNRLVNGLYIKYDEPRDTVKLGRNGRRLLTTING